jgi:hypothetical protein
MGVSLIHLLLGQYGVLVDAHCVDGVERQGLLDSQDEST